MIPAGIVLSRLRPWRADRERPSPNHGPRAGNRIRGVVLHATADGGNEAGSLAWLCNPQSEASAHLLIHRDGSVTRLVDDARRAWHAGVAEWRGSRDVNGMTLGWELSNRNDGREPYADAQYATVARLVAHYVAQGLTLDDVVSHADVALPKGRKTDPLGWDWDRLRREVLALTLPQPAPGIYAPEQARPALRLTPVQIDQALSWRALTREAAAPGVTVVEALLSEALRAGVEWGARELRNALADWLTNQRR